MAPSWGVALPNPHVATPPACCPAFSAASGDFSISHRLLRCPRCGGCAEDSFLHLGLPLMFKSSNSARRASSFPLSLCPPQSLRLSKDHCSISAQRGKHTPSSQSCRLSALCQVPGTQVQSSSIPSLLWEFTHSDRPKDSTLEREPICPTEPLLVLASSLAEITEPLLGIIGQEGQSAIFQRDGGKEETSNLEGGLHRSLTLC